MYVISDIKNYFLFIFMGSTILFGAYLTNISVVLVQPDNSELHCFTSGDEYYSWLHDGNGFPIIQSQVDGYYYYAERVRDILVPTLNRADKILSRNQNIENWSGITQENYLKRRQRYWTEFELYDAPSIGTINNINIFIRFNDELEFRFNCKDYDDPFNKEDGPSLYHYFYEVSYELLTVNTHHFPDCNIGSSNLSYQDEFPRAYYQPYNEITNPEGYVDCWDGNDDPEGFNCSDFPESQYGYIREHILLKKAIESIVGQIPSDLDVDGNDDLLVDNVTFLVNGGPTGWSDLLWPHRWSLTTYDVYINDSKVDAYNLNLLSGNPSYFTVGTLCHEFFHSLGAPDLYHYVDSPTPTPVGGWDIMEQSSDIPQYMSAWMKYRYANWLDCILIESGGTYALKPLQEQENSCYIIKSPYSESQFFTVEYRKQEGIYESNLPGNEDGLLVYRINLDLNNNGILDTAEVNNSWNRTIGGNADGPPDEVYLYRPGGTSLINGNLLEAIFSFESGRAQINDGTDPSSFLVESFIDDNENGFYDDGELFSDGNDDGIYGDRPGGLHILNVGEPGDSIQFDYVPFYLNTELAGITNDNDDDGVLNPGESATLHFSNGLFGYTNELKNLHISLTSAENWVSFSPTEIMIDGILENQEEYTFETTLSLDYINDLKPAPFTLSISAEYEDGPITLNYQDELQFAMDVTLNQAGFPLKTAEIRSSPLLIDLDNDGDKEIIFGDYNGIIHVLNNDGTEFNSTTFPFDTGDAIWGSPAAADLDRDGNIDFAVSSKSKHLYIFDMNGLKTDYETEVYLIGTPAIGNLDDDPELEVVFSGYFRNNKVFAINHDGTNVEGFPFNLFNYEYFETESGILDSSLVFEKVKAGVALADFNDNRRDDIVIGTDGNHIYLILDDGSKAPGFPFTAEDKFQTAPSILDVDGEKFIAAGNNNDTLYVINSDGSLRFSVGAGGKVNTSPVFFETGGIIYLAFGSKNDEIYLVDMNGNALPGWPVMINGNIEGSVICSDLDGDGEVEIVANTGKELSVFHLDGIPYPLFPIVFDFNYSGSPIITDIDLDADLEILGGSENGLKVIDIKEDGNNNNNFWNMYRRNPQRNGLFIAESDLAVSSFPELPKTFKIYPPFPNPFNPIINIQYQTPFHSHITMKVLDIRGRLVTQLVNKPHSPGVYDIIWDAGGYSSGIYFLQYILKGDNVPASQRFQIEKIVLLK